MDFRVAVLICILYVPKNPTDSRLGGVVHCLFQIPIPYNQNPLFQDGGMPHLIPSSTLSQNLVSTDGGHMMSNN